MIQFGVRGHTGKADTLNSDGSKSSSPSSLSSPRLSYGSTAGLLAYRGWNPENSFFCFLALISFQMFAGSYSEMLTGSSCKEKNRNWNDNGIVEQLTDPSMTHCSYLLPPYVWPRLVHSSSFSGFRQVLRNLNDGYFKTVFKLPPPPPSRPRAPRPRTPIHLDTPLLS